MPGFPNLFLLYGPNTNLGHSSIILMLEAQIRYVVVAVRHLQHRARLIEGRAKVLEQFDADAQRRMKGIVFAGGCRSWYVDADGRNAQNWPGTTLEFRLRIRRGRLADHVVTAPGSLVPASWRRLGGGAGRVRCAWIGGIRAVVRPCRPAGAREILTH